MGMLRRLFPSPVAIAMNNASTLPPILGPSAALKTSQDTLQAHRTFPYSHQKRKRKDNWTGFSS
jgi:hypothetical protein